LGGNASALIRRNGVLSNDGYVTTSDGVRLFYRRFGSGANAVIIPNAVHMVDSFKHLAGNRTLIFFDLRNRGGSDPVGDKSKLNRGVHHDVDDIDAIRRHFGIDQVDVIGHSYVGLTVILYAMKYAAHVRRVVQIGPIQRHAATQYPAHLTGADATLAAFMGKVAQLQMQPPPEDPREGCRKFWELMRELYVFNPADAAKIHWSPCDYPNEVGFLRHWLENLLPSIQAIELTGDDLSKVKTPVLTIHGTRDRQAPYGSGREWAMMLPDARLLTVENAAHVPWIEAPELVFGSIETFLEGGWPTGAEQVQSLDPAKKP
jgi:pimeloyl-ACP methyl ester carboxylesterase